MDNVDADWKENALEKAKTYQQSMDMSPEAIRDQLVSDYGEQFTKEEADYAIEHLESHINYQTVTICHRLINELSGNIY